MRAVLNVLACSLLLATVGAAAPAAYFDYVRTPVEAQVKLLSREPEFRIFSVSFPSLVQVDQSPNNTVYAWYYLPNTPRPAPAVIVLHEWGTRHAHRAKALSRELALRGVAALVVTLPYHMQRATRGSPAGELFLTRNPEQSLCNVRQAILDVRRAADWLDQQSGVDPSRLGIAGISLGAILADLAVGVDPRFSADVSILGAADVARVYWRSPLLWKRHREAKEHGWTLARVKRLFAPVEPSAYAGRLPPSQVLLINARHDFVLPHRAVQDLWKAFGRPRRLWIDSGHWGGLLAEGQVWRRAADFLQARLNGCVGPLHLAPIVVPVRLRVGVYEIEGTGPSLGLSLGLLRWGKLGQTSVELLFSRARPLLSLTYAVGEHWSVGYGLPLTGRKEPTAGAGIFATF